MTKRQLAVTAAALVLIVGVVTGRERPALELVQEARVAPAAAEDIDLGKLRRETGSAPHADPFATKTPQKAEKAAVAEKPQLPPLPFQYFGRLTENGKTDVFVMRGEELIAIAPGQKLGGDYRVDSIGEKSIAFTYLPLKTKQTLDLQ